jgi:hypothetical protein
MLRRRAMVLVIAGSLLLGKSICFSEEGTEEWQPVSAGPLTTWTAPLSGRGKFVLQPYVYYTTTRGMFDGSGRFAQLPAGEEQRQLQELVFMQYGLTDRLEIDVQTAWLQNRIVSGGNEANASGFADSVVYLRYCPHEEKAAVPHITAVLQVKVPTGKFENVDPGKLGADLTGTGSWDPGIGVIATKKVKPFITHADAVYSIPQEVTVNGVSTTYAPYFNYDFGVEYFLPSGFNLLLEANGLLQNNRIEAGSGVSASRTSYLMLTPGIGWSNETIQTLFGYQRTVTGINANAYDTFVLTCVVTF